MNLRRSGLWVSGAGHLTPRSGGYLHPMLRLFRAPFSTNVERVALALAHKGLEVESVVISYEDRSPVVEVSGQELVPVLVDDDVVVPDSVAILRYLEEKWPDPPLFPREAARRAELDVFLDWWGEVWKVAPNAIEAELERDEPDRARVKELGARMHDSLDLFERLLDGRDHLFGVRLLGRRLRRVPVPQVRQPARPRGRRALPPHPGGQPAARRRVSPPVRLDRPRERAPEGLGRQAEALRALHGLGAVAHAELPVERARVLLHRVR